MSRRARDHSGQQLAYVYFEDEPGRPTAFIGSPFPCDVSRNLFQEALLLAPPKPSRQKIVRRRVIRLAKWGTNTINGKPWREHMARLCNTTYCDLSIDLPDLAGWNVAFKRLDTAKNVTVSNLRIRRRTITRCDAQAQPDHLGLGFIVDDRTDVVIVIADRSQRRITMTHDYKRHGVTTLFAALDVLEGKVIGQSF